MVFAPVDPFHAIPFWLNNSTFDVILPSLIACCPIASMCRFNIRHLCFPTAYRAKMNALTIDNILSNRKNLERILDNMKDGIIAHDMSRRIFYFNKKAEEITGYRREDVVGKDCHEALGGPFCGSRCSFCDDQPIFLDTAEYPVNIVTREGEPRRLEMTATMMRDDKDREVGVLATFRDVTGLFELRVKAKEMTGFSNIIGCDDKMVDVYRQIKDVSGYDYPVHIFGETGTGKELVANAIHVESMRAGSPFVPINCGALPEGLIESELFGHVKGAFSGAIRDKKGRFELADKGTIFLDEIAELPKLLQVKLLRFLQEGTFEKVGGEKTVSVNVRVVSATNKDLKKEVKKGALPRGPVLPAQRDPHPHSSHPRTQIRHSAAGGPLFIPGTENRRASAGSHGPGRAEHAYGLRLAGQCARTSKRCPVRHRALQGQGDSTRRPAP
jgi:PAS domain S-box-containing protein